MVDASGNQFRCLTAMIEKLFCPMRVYHYIGQGRVRRCRIVSMPSFRTATVLIGVTSCPHKPEKVHDERDSFFTTGLYHWNTCNMLASMSYK